MKKTALLFFVILNGILCRAKMNVPIQTSGSGPLGPTNSLITFTSGGPPTYPTAIQELWGLNICGTNVQPVKIYNASLLVGYQSNNQNYGTGNLFATGFVGIGATDTKGYKFAVNGSVIANSVIVKLYPGADYVFKNDYQLPSLSDVKTYIDQNHHLPEIPSEQEVAQNGLNLGEMNRLLLKKVKELTLYLIEKDNKEKALEATGQKNSAEIALLKTQLQELATRPETK
ncbi:hypothetical protein [Mucilaginibacter flavus]|uniref:hypothetical protein n=1 Tax=Mucilaginibacter flavus TaxID=931504 RepID=UPI0025B5D5F3|nr:hypothetical protein [Mucilaginibacter flavus]MDN3581380.1 hypothetical protein [Mucilaginibacter flavus]